MIFFKKKNKNKQIEYKEPNYIYEDNSTGTEFPVCNRIKDIKLQKQFQLRESFDKKCTDAVKFAMDNKYPKVIVFSYEDLEFEYIIQVARRMMCKNKFINSFLPYIENGIVKGLRFTFAVLDTDYICYVDRYSVFNKYGHHRYSDIG